jgi:serine/threonine-protein kinase HipA
MKQLKVIIVDREVGTLEWDQGQLRFHYSEAWRVDEQSYPLSISLPLSQAVHEHSSIEPVLWGLLPDNPLIVERWASRFNVSPRNVFGLLEHVGEECAGAAQYVRQDRVETILQPTTPSVQWLDKSGIAERLRTLRTEPSAARKASDRGHFSLAGAQPKTALLCAKGQWGIPEGRTPTTHILKPPSASYEALVENEHLCLALSRAMGIPCARSEILRFEDEVAIVVERFDRPSIQVSKGDPSDNTGLGRRILRVHQEDFCQALGRSPALKYQRDGGPAPKDLANLLRDHSSDPREDGQTLLDALLFNWLIVGTDAHAKNYSLLFTRGPRIRMAPLYDLASYLPYDDDPQRTRLAMKLGGKYRLRDITRYHLEKLADELALDPADVVERAARMAETLPQQVNRVWGKAGVEHPSAAKLADLLAARASDCLRLLNA